MSGSVPASPAPSPALPCCSSPRCPGSAPAQPQRRGGPAPGIRGRCRAPADPRPRPALCPARPQPGAAGEGTGTGRTETGAGIAALPDTVRGGSSPLLPLGGSGGAEREQRGRGGSAPRPGLTPPPAEAAPAAAVPPLLFQRPREQGEEGETTRLVSPRGV